LEAVKSSTQGGFIEMEQKVGWILPDLNTASVEKITAFPTSTGKPNGRNTQLACCLRVPRGVSQGDGLLWLHAGEAKYEGIADDDYFLVRATCGESEQAPSFQRAMTRTEGPTLNLKDFGALIGQSGFGVDADDENLVSAITTLIFSLIFAMNARDELWERGKYTGKTAKSRVEFWTPNIIRKNYTLKGENSATHAGVSPRMHWRRGHMRQQPYGEGRSLRREQWIEPTLIAAE